MRKGRLWGIGDACTSILLVGSGLLWIISFSVSGIDPHETLCFRGRGFILFRYGGLRWGLLYRTVSNVLHLELIPSLRGYGLEESREGSSEGDGSEGWPACARMVDSCLKWSVVRMAFEGAGRRDKKDCAREGGEIRMEWRLLRSVEGLKSDKELRARIFSEGEGADDFIETVVAVELVDIEISYGFLCELEKESGGGGEQVLEWSEFCSVRTPGHILTLVDLEHKREALAAENPELAS
ncbi:hypothetical protein Tco_0959510 [Tanacetum coccineum]